MPSARRDGSPSTRYNGVGWTMARADHGPPSTPGMLEIICAGAGESGQNWQKDSARGALSGTSSPVITHERVMGSLRNSMGLRKTSARRTVNCDLRHREATVSFVIIRPRTHFR